VSLVALCLASSELHAASLNSISTVAPTAAVQAAAAAAAQAATQAAAQAQMSLSRAAAALAAARLAQQKAAALTTQPKLGNGQAIPEGVGTGGLMPTGGVTGQGCGASCTAFQLNTPTSFNGALSTLVQTVDGGQTTVNVTQTQQQAIYNWDSFNISRNTTLNFNQQGSDWTALNRVNPNTSPILFLQQATANNGYNNPSYIGGKINAPGNVYVINRNGIIFGAGAQINVHSLVASVLDVGDLTAPDQVARDNYFLGTGIASGTSTSFSLFDPVNGANSTLIPGNVTVEAGASINASIATDVRPEGSAGFIYMFGANVYNNGMLTAPQGEVAMAAARAVTLTPNTDGAAKFPSNVLPSGVSFRGTGLQIQNYGTFDPSGNLSSIYYRDEVNHIVTGEVSHGGVIDVREGVALLIGDRISVTDLQSGGSLVRDAAGNLIPGVISADTSISRNSMVLMHAATSVQFDGVISMLPYDDGNTLPTASGANTSSDVQGYMPAYVELDAQRSVTLGSASLVSAPSASVSVNAVTLDNLHGRSLFTTINAGVPQTLIPTLGGVQQVVLNGSDADGPGAVIDVAGLQDVVLPASANFTSFMALEQLADMPLQRNGVLNGKTLWIDIRASGTRADGTTWVGTPLADASGAVSGVGRSIRQLMTAGGTVSLMTDLDVAAVSQILASGGRVTANSGSVINVAGGKITYLPGMVPSTRLIGIDGRIYSMANADPNMVYVGIFGQFSVDHPRWGVTETWSIGTQTYSPGYTEGRDAGGVNVATLTPQLNLGGQMYFGSVAGERQIALGQAPSDTSDSTRPTAKQAKGDELPSQGFLTISTPVSEVQIGPTPSSKFNTSAPVVQLSADTLSGYGLSALTISAPDLVLSAGSTLNLAAGGQFSASVGGAIDIAGTIAAAGGKISLSTDSSLTYDSNSWRVPAPHDAATGDIAANIYVEGTLDVSGRFVNDTGRSGADQQGPGFINGGSISITTNKFSIGDVNSSRDFTGSILLASGSRLDVSSGGYISSQGKAKMASSGSMAGKGGSISLALYQDNWKSGNPNDQTFHQPTSGSRAVLQLGGALLAYGFESNGSLRLSVADTIRIGDTALQPGELSTIKVGQGSTVPTALLNSGGFSSYTFESNSDGYATPGSSTIVLSADTGLNLQQNNFSSALNYGATPTGAKLGVAAQQAPATQLALLPDDQRKPVDLTLKADNVVLDTGSSISTDARAKITIGGSPDPAMSANAALRDKRASNVLLRGSIVDHGGTLFINALKTVFDEWLPQQQARIDLSGTYIANSQFGQPSGPAVGGTVIAGGTFSIETGTLQNVLNSTADANGNLPTAYDAAGGFVMADSGLQVDVSGYAGLVQTVPGRGQASSSIWLWSDAGTISVDAAGFAWGGSFAATGGRLSNGTALLAADGKTPIANNGTIILGGGAVALQQDNAAALAALAAFHRTGTVPNKVFVSADQLAPFDNVFLYSGGAFGGAGRIFTDLTANTTNLGAVGFQPLTITGPLNWQVANRLHIAASSIATAQDGTSVALAAPYVLLTGGGGSVQSGSSTMSVTGQTIDVEGAAFSGFSRVQIKSSGDLRLSTPKVANTYNSSTSQVTGPSTFSGTLTTYGDLLLSAQRIYPVSAVDFTIQSTAGNVKFAAPAGSNTSIPLSAGGSLTVKATNIDQAGNLFAPLGKITLTGGSGTNPDGSNQGVVLEPGSLTSVTLADTTVPYGATADGTGWYYNSNAQALAAPPTKGLELGGASVQVQAGSVIDERGGGDLQAMEWIPGKGGSHDTLTTITGGLANGSGAGPTVYALVPSSNDAVSAFDINFTAGSLPNAAGQSGTAFRLPSGQQLYLQSGDVYPLAGTQITINGGGGLPAGTYTLYPAHYATLPGALRVVYYGDTTGRSVPSGATQPDGTVLVTGTYTQSTAPGKQSSGQALFAVQTGAVWQQYSEYSFNSANSYFVQKAGHDGTNVPRLPIDAGRLAVNAQQQIVLAGTALVQPAPGGRGSELDIAGNKLAVVGHQQYVDSSAPGNVPSGYIPIDVSQLNGFGFESVMIGGLRTDNDPNDPIKGTLITPTATNVVVDTRGEAWIAPEVLLVTQTGQWQQDQWFQVGSTWVDVPLPVYVPVADGGQVTVKAGSIIETTGIVHGGYGRNYHFAASNTAAPTAQQIAQALGGTLDSTGTVITGVDLGKLAAFWYSNNFGSVTRTTGAVDPTTMVSYGGTGANLGALFAASNDPNLVVSGPSGAPAQSLTIQFADLKSGEVSGVQAGPVKNLDGSTGGLVLPGGDAGRVTVEAGARITTDALTLQATASTNAIAIKGDVQARQANLNAQTFAIGTGAGSAANASVQLLGSEFADVQRLTLKSLSGAISVYGNFDAGPAMANLTLDAAAVARATGSGDGKVSVENGSITLINSSGLALPSGLPSGENNPLVFEASDIVLGGGTQSIVGSYFVTMKATDRIVIGGPGALNLGIANLTMATPTVLVAGATSAGSGSFTLNTLGDVTLTDIVARTGMAERPADSAEIGGNLAILASHITVGNTLQAQAGTITLEASGGSLARQASVNLVDGGYIAAGGYAKTLVDTTTYVAGGKVVLQADGTGNVVTSVNSVIDVAQPTDGVGYGGQIQISATGGRAVVLGDLRGRGGNGLGGAIKIDANSLQVDGNGLDPNASLDVKLDALADRLVAGGVNGAIDIHTRAGNLTLSAGHTLKANSVTLTADDTTWDDNNSARQFGQVTIAGTIDASGYIGDTADGTGQAGGQVGLYGANQVTLAGTSLIDASTKHADERGGDVMVAIPWAAKGKIRLQDGMVIDVTGGTRGGLSGGTVTFRAPVDGKGGAKIVQIDANGAERSTFDGSLIHIKGARTVDVEGFISFDTVQSVYGIDGSSLGWDGHVDPANAYDSSGNKVLSGSWTGVTGYQVALTNGGSGYTSTPTILWNGSPGILTAVMGPDGNGTLKVVGLACANPAVCSTMTLSSAVLVNAFGGGGSGAQITVSQISTLRGMQDANGVYTVDPTSIGQQGQGVIVFASSGKPDPTKAIFSPDGAHGTINVDLMAFSQGNLILNNQDYGFLNLINSLKPLAQQLGDGVVHVTPGIQLVNSDASKNSGNITVDSAWNLASGTAYNLQSNGSNGTKYVQVDEASNTAQQSYVKFDYRLLADYGTGQMAVEAGALTLRALNNVVIGASISDGFFQFHNYLDPTYDDSTKSTSALNMYLSSARTSGNYYLNGYAPVPIAPYNAAGNVVSPTAPDLAVADLFPNELRVCIVVATCGTPNFNSQTDSRIVTDPGSWTYRITAGANLGSGNPDAVRPLDTTIYNPKYVTTYNLQNSSKTPSVIITGTGSYSQPLHGNAIQSTVVALPTMVRTGTGAIDVTAAYDVFLNDPNPASPTSNAAAPGVIYAAGVNTPRLADPQYTLQTINGISQVVVGNTAVDPDQLFLEPQLLAYAGVVRTSSLYAIYGPLTAAAFPHMGGDVEIMAQNDIVGYSPAIPTTAKTNYQYYQQWLIANVGLTLATVATAGSVSLVGQGVFAPIGTSVASQTAWWIQYGSFDQGILSTGGNVTVTAGRDLNDVSVSLPTTGRVSGGLTATSTPITHVYDSGNMTVSAGRDILGGSFYEGSGHASIVAGRSVVATSEKLAWIGTANPSTNTANFVVPVLLDNLPLLAVDLGGIQVTAGGSLSMMGVINPAGLTGGVLSPANPLGFNGPIRMDTYGPQSGVSLLAVTGDLRIALAPTTISANSTVSAVYPASFAAVALEGDIATTGFEVINTQGNNVNYSVPGMILTGSEQGDFQFVAGGSIDLTFGSASNTLGSGKPVISAGPALLDKAFDPFRPNAWYGTHLDDPTYAGAFSSAVLAHQDEADIARIIAATGDIVGRGGVTVSLTNAVTSINRIEINRPTEVYAGGDITDLNLIVQNIRPSDVSSVIAGGDITYTGQNAAGGLQVAGPGFFLVQAGRDIGPFVPASFDTTTAVAFQQGIASVGNASLTPVGNGFTNYQTGMYPIAVLGPRTNMRRNKLIGGEGADLITLFGVSKGIDYAAVLAAYVDPANAANVSHNYIGELQAFLVRIGVVPGADPLATFASLPENLQHVFVDQVFFAELKAVARSGQGQGGTARGYQMIETMFPASYGYSSNDGGATTVETGDLNLFHATIQTRLGGDISIFGPGGNILVGPLTPEKNPNLKLRDVGILTLGNGAINTFTDQSVRVNSSRVLTTQGGDVLMWSSNGDLDAGRGSKTTLSFPPLQVLFDNNDYQFTDLGGFVSGAGIGTVKASFLTESSDLYLLAPRGFIDFGVAGGRSSGNLVVLAPVVLNATNIQVQGTTTGIPTVTVPNTAGLTSAGNSAAAATKSTQAPTASGGGDRASVFLVEVVSYGGGDGEAATPASSSAAPASGPSSTSSPASNPEPAAQPGATSPAQKDDNDRKKRSQL
jgi:filamentous hemagglutinin family protein